MLLLLQSLHHPILCCTQNPKPKPKSNPKLLPHQPFLLLQFRNSQRQNRLRYLKNLGLKPATSSPSDETLHWILSVVDFLKSKGFSDSDFPRLSFLAPSIFSSLDVDRSLNPVFSFLYNDLLASPQQARGLILRCPTLLTSNITYCLQPTLSFLRELGIKNLNVPTNLNAHLLNTPVDKLISKIEFLEDWGLNREDASKICARCPAIFGYSDENNLRPKVEYLVYKMKRSIEEVKEFPQYFGFSLERRIVPRYLYLEQRKVSVPMRNMLAWSDEKFYAKWK